MFIHVRRGTSLGGAGGGGALQTSIRHEGHKDSDYQDRHCSRNADDCGHSNRCRRTTVLSNGRLCTAATDRSDSLWTNVDSHEDRMAFGLCDGHFVATARARCCEQEADVHPMWSISVKLAVLSNRGGPKAN